MLTFNFFQAGTGTSNAYERSIQTVCRECTASSNPVLFGRILEAQRRGTKICAVDSRYTPTMAKADMTQIIRPASGNWLGLYLMKIFLEEKSFAPESMATGTIHTESWQNSFARMPSEAALHATGVPFDRIRPLARLLSGCSPVTVITGRALETLEYFCGLRGHPAIQASHMVFPAAAWPERDELCFCENSTLQWGRRIVAPADSCPAPDEQQCPGMAAGSDRFPLLHTMSFDSGDGDPTCVKVCPTGAITFEEISVDSRMKLIANAGNYSGMVKQALGAA